MRQLIDPDSPVMRMITKITTTVYLNILWFICCIPVVTAGASTTALFYVSQKMVRDEEGSITRSFFRSFKENFKQATVIWLILLAIGILLGVDGYVLYHMRFQNAFWTVLTAIFLVALAAYIIELMYIFPLLAHFENTTKEMFKNAIMIGMRFLFCTIVMFAIYALMAYLIVFTFTPIVIFGEGLCAFLCSYLLKNILIQCENRDEDGEEYDSDSKEEE